MTNPCPSARGSEQARETPQSGQRSCAGGRAKHRGCPSSTEPALQERRNNLEQLHRQAAAEASHGAEATQLEIMFPDGITKHLHQEAKDSLKRAADLDEEERKAEAAAKEAATRPTKEAMELDEFGGLDDQDDPTPDPTAEARIQASIDELLQAQTRGDPERLAVLRAQMDRDLSSPVPKKKPKRGSTGRRRAAEISTVTINGNFRTMLAERMTQEGPRHLVLGQEHRQM